MPLFHIRGMTSCRAVSFVIKSHNTHVNKVLYVGRRCLPLHPSTRCHSVRGWSLFGGGPTSWCSHVPHKVAGNGKYHCFSFHFQLRKSRSSHNIDKQWAVVTGKWLDCGIGRETAITAMALALNFLRMRDEKFGQNS